MSCIVPDCTSARKYAQKGISFHTIPKDDILRKMWLDEIGVTNFTVVERSYVCSKHFHEIDLIRTAGHVHLTRNAIPHVKGAAKHENITLATSAELNQLRRFGTKKCCVPHCSTTHYVSLHHFPKDKELKDKWISNLGLLSVTPSMVVCNNHFSSTDYFRHIEIKRRNYLKIGAVPTQNLRTDGLLNPVLHQSINCDLEKEECEYVPGNNNVTRNSHSRDDKCIQSNDYIPGTKRKLKLNAMPKFTPKIDATIISSFNPNSEDSTDDTENLSLCIYDTDSGGSQCGGGELLGQEAKNYDQDVMVVEDKDDQLISDKTITVIAASSNTQDQFIIKFLDDKDVTNATEYCDGGHSLAASGQHQNSINFQQINDQYSNKESGYKYECIEDQIDSFHIRLLENTE